MSMKYGKKKSKTTNYFSHDFIISNHGDIVSIVAMVFVVGLLTRMTNPIASKFVILQHNTTIENDNQFLYYPGLYDFCSVIFYTLMCIIFHAVIQEYVLDKFCKRSSLTRTRLSRFNYSSQLAIFFGTSLYFLFYLILSEGVVSSFSDLWIGYPHVPISFWTKAYFIFQISYWVHIIPELYFQKVKREEMPPRVIQAAIYLVVIVGSYFLSFIKLAIVISLFQYIGDFIYYLGHAYHLANKENISQVIMKVYDITFFPIRLIITIISGLIFQYGLVKESTSTIDFENRNFNTFLIRMNCFTLIVGLQVYLSWNFIKFYLKKRREQKLYSTNAASKVTDQKKKKKQ